jgi:hypothetical protein
VSTVETSEPARGVAVEPMILRAAGGTYVVFGMLSAIPFIFGLAPQLLGRPILGELIAIGGIVSFLSLVWIRSFRLELTPDELRYRSLFGRSRQVRYDAIERAEIQVGVAEPGDRLRPRYRLVVVPRDAEERPIVVNLKVFPFEPLKSVCAAVGATLVGDGT